MGFGRFRVRWCPKGPPSPNPPFFRFWLCFCFFVDCLVVFCFLFGFFQRVGPFSFHLTGFEVLFSQHPFVDMFFELHQNVSKQPLVFKVSKVSVFGVAYFVFFQACFSENTLSIVVSENFKQQIWIKKGHCLMVRFWPKLMVRFWPNLGDTKKTKWGQNLTIKLLTFSARKKQKHSTPCVWLKK